MGDKSEAVNNKDNVVMNGIQPSDSEENDKSLFKDSYYFSLPEAYKLTLLFYKDKEGGKALHTTYKDKLHLVSLTKQISHGKCTPDVCPEVGFLDMVGNDRRQAWLHLGEMSKEQAMQEFVTLVDKICPLLRPYLEAHKREEEEQERRRKEEEDRLRLAEEERKRQQEEEEAFQRQQSAIQYQAHEAQIRAALNQQTAYQFRQYAQQQYPNDLRQQDVLIHQLQEQHYQQYMQQVYQQQILQQQQHMQFLQQSNSLPGKTTGESQLTTKPLLQTAGGVLPIPVNNKDNSHEVDTEEDSGDSKKPPVKLAAPSMWTRKDISEFKKSLKTEPDTQIKVGSGETVTVRVPTHQNGTCLYWEFATDSYDVGFGLYFEWTPTNSDQVSVHVSESSEEDEAEEEGEGSASSPAGDLERGGHRVEKVVPPTDEIIPIYRRDSHQEVFCGSHVYPGRGVYLLKFDNSYSLWRSKTLYYRVYYSSS